MTREIRSNQQPLAANGKTVSGCAVVYNSQTNIAGLWTERFLPGAFRSTLSANADVLALYSHALERLLGRRSSGTLRLTDDDQGLKVEIDLPDTTDGRDVAELVGRGDLKGMSFGFIATQQEWDDTTTPPTRTIIQADLFEVTVTADPQYEDTEIGLRDMQRAQTDRATSARQANRTGYALRKAQHDHRIRGL
jgi:HK97 family phage prohead protease